MVDSKHFTPVFDYKLTFENSQHKNTNEDYVLKKTVLNVGYKDF